MNSITKRWIKGNLLITIIILVFAQISIAFFLRNSYYTQAQAAILNRISSINGTIATSANLEGSDRLDILVTMSEEFTEKDKFAFMLIGENGQIVSTTTGFYPSDDTHIVDMMNATVSDGVYINQYRTAMNEKVISGTSIIFPSIQGVYAVRLVTSLKNVDKQIYFIMAFLFIASVIVVGVSLFSGLYFVKSIVNPVKSIEKTAKEISTGNFDVRIDNKFNDEIGALCNTINDMAQELGKSDDIKNEFISSVSHELRTPLTAIKGWAETMSNTQDKETLSRGTNVILTETERLYAMVENLLDFSKLQKYGISLSKEKLDLVAEVTDIIIMFEPRCKQYGIEIVYDEPMDIMPVFGDKNRIKQVLINLLDNSIKYSKENSKIEVKVFIQNGKKAVIQVTDFGKGIHPDDIEKVKQKFFKARESKRGSGIGLALVNEIMLAHSGTFDITSEYKKSTTATIAFNLIRTWKGTK